MDEVILLERLDGRRQSVAPCRPNLDVGPSRRRIASRLHALLQVGPALAADFLHQDGKRRMAADSFDDLVWRTGERVGDELVAVGETLLHQQFRSRTAGGIRIPETLDAALSARRRVDGELHEAFTARPV